MSVILVAEWMQFSKLPGWEMQLSGLWPPSSCGYSSVTDFDLPEAPNFFLCKKEVLNITHPMQLLLGRGRDLVRRRQSWVLFSISPAFTSKFAPAVPDFGGELFKHPTCMEAKCNQVVTFFLLFPVIRKET